ncbi:hypothetical protein [Paraburkholderia sp.]|uniref:hypothetical protein n=1 Tax=Paraburkholderia sp. TaxID=1926495 RepID=UPI003D6F63A2
MLKRFFPLVVLATTLLIEAACAVQPTTVGQAIELAGKLVLRGNEPFVYPVVYDRRGVWQLDGVPSARASALQNQQVIVRGTVVRLDPSGIQLPMVHVESLTTP